MRGGCACIAVPGGAGKEPRNAGGFAHAPLYSRKKASAFFASAAELPPLPPLVVGPPPVAYQCSTAVSTGPQPTALKVSRAAFSVAPVTVRSCATLSFCGRVRRFCFRRFFLVRVMAAARGGGVFLG